MKKTIFSFAIAAVAAVAMVSCGNKTDNTGSGEATPEDEQAT
jgi:hypothetical protein